MNKFEISQKSEITSHRKFHPCPGVSPGESAKPLNQGQMDPAKPHVLLCQKHTYYQPKQPVLSSPPSFKAIKLLLLDAVMPALTFWTVSLFELQHFCISSFIWKTFAF